MIKQFLALVGLSILSLAASAALYDRGNGLIYDDVLDITWLQDANYAQTSGYDATGAMTWADANIWAASLSYGGYDDWRLASANLMSGANPCYAYDGSCDQGYNNTTGEMGHMFYNNLGGLSYYDTNGIGPQLGFGEPDTSFIDGGSGDSVSILNLQSFWYWLGEESIHYPNTDWAFSISTGDQDDLDEGGLLS